MDAINNGWFAELSELWPGQAMNLKVKEVLHNERTKFQDLIVFEVCPRSRTLALVTFAYELLASLLMLLSSPFVFCSPRLLVVC